MHRQFLKAGYPVFSIRPIINGKCSCGCEKGGKHPYDNSWQHTPVWSDEKLEEQERRGRMANYGVLVKGLLVVDIDPKNGGSPDMLDLSVCKFVVRTGSGGWHYYFKASGNFPANTPRISRHRFQILRVCCGSRFRAFVWRELYC